MACVTGRPGPVVGHGVIRCGVHHMHASWKAELTLSTSTDRLVRGRPALAETQDAKRQDQAFEGGASEGRGSKVRATLRARLGDDIFSSWFNALEFDAFDGKTVKVSVPVKFLRNWIQSHYLDDLLTCCRVEFKTAERVEVVLRQPGGGAGRPAVAQPEPLKPRDATAAETRMAASAEPLRLATVRPLGNIAGRTSVGGFEGSPLDPHHTVDNFVVGASNRMAHAGAIQVAETVLSDS